VYRFVQLQAMPCTGKSQHLLQLAGTQHLLQLAGTKGRKVLKSLTVAALMPTPFQILLTVVNAVAGRAEAA
jgi:hypothetical protein